MFIPDTIENNTLAVYHMEYIRNSKRLLKSEDFTDWCSNFAKPLRNICLNTIVSHWTEYPIINEIRLEDDVRYVLDNLPSDLPFKLAVTHIHDELYWRRVFRKRWPGKMLPEKPQKLDYEIPNQCSRYVNRCKDKNEDEGDIIVKSNTWKCFYIERHLQNLLEHLKPEQYNAQEMKDLIELSKDYIIRLKLNQLQAPIEHEKERIPLHAILPALPNLKQLTMCFKQTYVGDDFSWHVLQTPHKDVENLANGLKACDLNILRIVNTDITCDKVTMLACNLKSNSQLRILDFSHCKIGDKGTTAICKLLLESTTFEEINLMNNFIGTNGIEMLAYTLSKPEVKLKKLDLSLNNFGKNGADSLAAMLLTNTKLIKLCLSACGLTKRNVRLLIQSLETNRTLKLLDLSNNKFDESLGIQFCKLFDESKNITLKTLDLRMTTLSAEVILHIEETLHHNSSRKARINGHIKQIKPPSETESVLVAINCGNMSRSSGSNDNHLGIKILESKEGEQTDEDIKIESFPQFNIIELETKLDDVFRDYLSSSLNVEQMEEDEIECDGAEEINLQQEINAGVDNETKELEKVLK